MKTNTKRLLSMIVALVMILSMLPLVTSAATPTTLYLKPNSNWVKDSARFAAYFFGNGEKWVSMTDTDGDGYYEVAVPSGYPNVIFCRMDPGASANNWSNKWNQTSDLTIPTDGTNCYTVKEDTWDTGGGTWGIYAPVAPTAALAGTLTSWDASDANNLMSVENGKATKTLDLKAGTYQFKIVKNGSTWLGNTATVADATTADLIMIDTGNCTLTASGGTYTFVFDMSTNALSISYVPALPDPGVTEPEVSDPTEPETPPDVLSRSVTINYHNSNLWDAINVYAWDASSFIGNAWPGAAMTAVEGHENWFTYTLSVATGITDINVIFNNGTAQTGDLSITGMPTEDCTYYYADGVFTAEAPDKWENGAIELIKHDVSLHFQDNNNWSEVYAYIWTDTNGALEAWPGIKISTDDGYNKWYFLTVYEYTNSDMKVIFNDGAGGLEKQTADLYISELPEGYSEYWYIPGTEHWSTGELSDKAPESYIKQDTAVCNVTVHFQNTLGWETVNGYSWTNIWPAQYPSEAWPGTELTAEDGWYTLSFDAVYVVGDGASVIFNTPNGDGYLQTADLVIDCDGKDAVEKWVIPTGTQTDYLSYECDIFDEMPVYVAQVGETKYYALADAIEDANGQLITLVGDNYVPTTIEANVTIDLAGFKLDEITVADGYALTLISSANDDYESFSGVAYVKGTVNTLATVDSKNYIVIDTDGQLTVHRYDVEITHISLQPGKDALGFKATVKGDSDVQSAVTGFGFDMSVAGGKAVTFQKDKSPTNGQFSLRLQGILAANGGETTVIGKPFVIFGEKVVYGAEQQTSMQEAIQEVDAAWDTYDQEKQDAVIALLTGYPDLISKWNLSNISVAE